MAADACYHAGARKVTVTGSIRALEKLAIRRESQTPRPSPTGSARSFSIGVDTLPCRIYLLSEDPDGLRRQPRKDGQRRQALQSSSHTATGAEGRYQWCIAPCPARGVGEAKVFARDEIARRSSA